MYVIIGASSHLLDASAAKPTLKIKGAGGVAPGAAIKIAHSAPQAPIKLKGTNASIKVNLTPTTAVAATPQPAVTPVAPIDPCKNGMHCCVASGNLWCSCCCLSCYTKPSKDCRKDH